MHAGAGKSVMDGGVEFTRRFGARHSAFLWSKVERDQKPFGLSLWSSAHCWHNKFGAGAYAGRPSGCDGFQFGIESHTFGAMDMMVAEDGSFPTAE
jgi:hypothetical protein